MLIQAFTDHSLTELNVEDGGVKVCLKKDGTAAAGNTTAGGIQASVVSETGAPAVPAAVPGTGVSAVPAVAGAGMPAVPAVAGAGIPAQAAIPGTVMPVSSVVPGAAMPAQAVIPGTAMPASVMTPGMGVPGSAPVQAAGIQAAPDGPAIGSDKIVVSPLVGIFYSASSPEAENFVKVGDTVKKGQVLGIIEAMKLMNEIESEYDGVVEAILVKNEDVVEYGQPLFRIR